MKIRRSGPRDETPADAFLFRGRSEPPRVRRTSKSRRRTGANAEVEVRAMMDTGEWSAAEPMHWAALYSVMHQEVYGCTSAELADRAGWVKAASIARNALRKYFDGDAVLFAEFQRWSWDRERRAREQALARKREPWHMSVVGAYAPGLVSKWRAVEGAKWG